MIRIERIEVCGVTFERVDDNGDRRIDIDGNEVAEEHLADLAEVARWFLAAGKATATPRPASAPGATQKAVLGAMSTAIAKPPADIAAAAGLSVGLVRGVLVRAAAAGLVERVGRGFYRLKGGVL